MIKHGSAAAIRTFLNVADGANNSSQFGNSKITVKTSGSGTHTTQSWCRTVIAIIIGGGGGGGHAAYRWQDTDDGYEEKGTGGNGGHGGQNFKTRNVSGATGLSYSVGAGGGTGSGNGGAGGASTFDGTTAGGGGGGAGTTYGGGANGGWGSGVGNFFSSMYGVGGAGARPGPYSRGGGVTSHGSGIRYNVSFAATSGGQRAGIHGAIFILELG